MHGLDASPDSRSLAVHDYAWRSDGSGVNGIGDALQVSAGRIASTQALSYVRSALTPHPTSEAATGGSETMRAKEREKADDNCNEMRSSRITE